MPSSRIKNGVTTVTFQITDFPRILPELMLLALGLLVLGSDVLERWGNDPKSKLERRKAAGQLAAIGLGIVFVVCLVQSGYLFTVREPLPPGGTNGLLNFFINLGRNLQAAGPGGELSGQPILSAFATDNLTMVARLIFIGAAFFTTLLMLDFKNVSNPGEFYALLLFSTAGMCIMAASTELILAFIALELSSITLYVLAGYLRNDERSVEAGLKYFLFGAISSGIMLYGMSLAYGFTASVNQGADPSQAIGTTFSQIGQAVATTQQAGQADGNLLMVTLALIFIIAGLGYKIAVVPFHSWSPDVYQGAPTPMTAFISTASKAAGFILLYRLLVTAFPNVAGTPGFNNGWTSLLAFIALLTVVIGNLSALPQTNAKRLLAYSSIGHAGFLLLAFLLGGLASPDSQTFGTAPLLYYLIVYTFMSLGAFGVLAVVSESLGGDDMSDLSGLAKRNLGLATMMSIFILSLAGIPPLSGFWAKFFVFMSGYRAGALPLVIVAAVMTVVSLYYYLRFLKVMWMQEPSSDERVITPPAMNTTIIATAVLVIVLGLFPNLIWGILDQVVVIAGR
ncbi:MAG: NADH-quinone oxidoreductase subunit N 1 [Chloroflexi bacterium AL-W]|nr:NADH-quinone oxidoreductase subunit N 1 [Chloroflexi bacterium AL-N1]NOK68838.1 NADH-quinone oxidoreductase subunit N 1 [Chloroflexi bacterium AL-N10]NOK76822.1 NADH-quinone oxidoreductase subunit N 1 [Chloroflexi bacterium AL-N5]NOK82791.1 NADH-quinone oxidoreductase subunit N 1 [Chloroflexi bacterium AL-W]NOK90679.1 NADH-quinone oxidoreductase subunit N 1 [Chloroflexi bacterium AL-N15]